MFDVAIIGAGVVGAAIARTLSHYDLSTLLIDGAHDVGTGTSKANTAILHTGFDAKPGTVESRLVRRGYDLLRAYADEVGIPVEPLGALLVAWDDAQRAALPAIADSARANGYDAARIISADELYLAEPHLGRGARAALTVPHESIICPFTTPLAFATEAVLNGTALRLSSAVTAITPGIEVHQIQTTTDTIAARFVVNAAGLNADYIDAWFGHRYFRVRPRRGELIVYDKLARALVRHIVLQVPTAVSKGVLISPTVFGNVMLGPTAEDIDDREATGSTANGIARLRERGRRIMPELVDEEVTAVYVGLRAATEHTDYQIRFHPDQRYVCVGGIRSTGLSASMAIAEYVLDGLRDAGLSLRRKHTLRPMRMPNIGEAFPRPYQRADMIANNPDYGRIVCHCERVTRGEIFDATCAPIPAHSLDAVRRRTRALLGRCQGFFCLATVAALVAEATGQPIDALLTRLTLPHRLP
jgi:glycerol-3-phosphate dehydrogenase